MWALHNATPEHWVPISTIASFKRMREFASFGVEWVAKALRLSDELEVDEASTNVRRLTELQEPQNQFDRSIYAVSNFVDAVPLAFQPTSLERLRE
jgi:lupus La protein